MNAQGTGAGSDVTAGIKWVVDHGAKVVNLSLGDPAQPITALISENELKEGVDYAWSHGAIAVLASGNSGTGLGIEGANFGDMNAIVVGATGPDDKPASYSTSTGEAKWAVAAPGGAGRQAERRPTTSTRPSGSTARRTPTPTWPAPRWPPPT